MRAYGDAILHTARSCYPKKLSFTQCHASPVISTPAFAPPCLPAAPSLTTPSLPPVITEPAFPPSPVMRPQEQPLPAKSVSAPSRPGTRSQTAHMTNSQVASGAKKASWADVITKTDEDITDTQSPFSRPRGRPPKGHHWDENIGEYVPTYPVLVSPSTQKAWILAVSNDVRDYGRPPNTYIV